MLHPTHSFFTSILIMYRRINIHQAIQLLPFGHGYYNDGFILKPNIGHPYSLIYTTR